MRSYRQDQNRRALLVLFLAVVALAVSYENYRFAEHAPVGADLLPRWLGTRLWLTQGISPYDPSVADQAQQILYGRPADPQAGEDLAQFEDPAPFALFMLPFALLPFPLARALWMTLSEAGLLGLTLMGLQLARWRPRPLLLGLLLVFSLAWYQGVRAVILGEFAVIEAVLIAGALWAAQREQDAVAGVLLALCLCQPGFVALLAPYMLLWGLLNRRPGLALWTLGAAIVLFGGFAVILPSWPLEWMRQVVGSQGAGAAGSPISLAAAALPFPSFWLAIGLSGAVMIYLLWEWILSAGKPDRWFQWTAAVSLVITQLVTVRPATTNSIVFVPGILLVFSLWCQRWGRTGAVATAGAILALVGLPWLAFLRSPQGNQETPLMLAGVPLIVLFGLWWVRWWATRSDVLQIGQTNGWHSL
jgi:Glycosyltransferase family 87